MLSETSRHPPPPPIPIMPVPWRLSKQWKALGSLPQACSAPAVTSGHTWTDCHVLPDLYVWKPVMRSEDLLGGSQSLLACGSVPPPATFPDDSSAIQRHSTTTLPQTHHQSSAGRWSANDNPSTFSAQPGHEAEGRSCRHTQGTEAFINHSTPHPRPCQTPAMHSKAHHVFPSGIMPPHTPSAR